MPPRYETTLWSTIRINTRIASTISCLKFQLFLVFLKSLFGIEFVSCQHTVTCKHKSEGIFLNLNFLNSYIYIIYTYIQWQLVTFEWREFIWQMSLNHNFSYFRLELIKLTNQRLVNSLNLIELYKLWSGLF